MALSRPNSSTLISASVTVAVLFAVPCQAVIIHPEDEPPDAVNTPGSAVVGRWHDDSSAVAIAPNHLITTRHQRRGVGTSVVFDGAPYIIAAVTNHPTADLRVCRITTPSGAPANLRHIVWLYRADDEVGKEVLLGSSGLGRGAELKNGATTYGYAWGDPGSEQVRWGRNRIDATADDVSDGERVSNVVIADFDGPHAASSLEAEGIGANGDSGGGWFIQDGARWRVAGMFRGVEHPFEAWFLNASTLAPDPDAFDGVRISNYATFIDSVLGPAPGDFDNDLDVDHNDFGLFQACMTGPAIGPVSSECEAMDFDNDDDVDGTDFGVFQRCLSGAGVEADRRCSLPPPSN